MFVDKIKNQLRRLYLSNFISNISIAGAAWVLLLVNDGYSLIQVGLAETVFHIVSLTFEIPSGVFADTLGRKKSLIMSSIATLLSAFVRGFLPGFGFVLVSIAFSALSYNFASGSDSALRRQALHRHNPASRVPFATRSESSTVSWDQARDRSAQQALQPTSPKPQRHSVRPSLTSRDTIKHFPPPKVNKKIQDFSS